MGSAKQKLYGDDSYPDQLQRQAWLEIWILLWSRVGKSDKSGKSGISHGNGEDHVGVNYVYNVCDSAH